MPQLRESVNVWRDFVPVIQYLRNPDMKDRHWAKVNDQTHLSIERGEALTLRVLMGMQVRGGQGMGGANEGLDYRPWHCCLTCPYTPVTVSPPLPSQIMSHKDVVGTVSTEATQEAGLEDMLARVVDKWKQAEFVVNPYKEMKDTYILVG